MIELQNVDKKFRDIHAADQISAKIQDGMIFGLVGSNGAGKSTLLRMISGIIKPDSGEILADGEPPMGGRTNTVFAKPFFTSHLI